MAKEDGGKIDCSFGIRMGVVGSVPRKNSCRKIFLSRVLNNEQEFHIFCQCKIPGLPTSGPLPELVKNVLGCRLRPKD